MNIQRFGNQVITLRNALGMNREELALKLQLSYGHLNNIELGNRMPSVEVILALAHCLKVPSGYLFQQLDDEVQYQLESGSYALIVDPENYLALPQDLSKEEKEEIREFARFKQARKEEARTKNKEQSRIRNIEDENIEMKPLGMLRIVEGIFVFKSAERSSSKKPITVHLYLRIGTYQADAIITDLSLQGINQGESVTNASEHLATTLVKRFELNPQKFSLVERYLYSPTTPDYANTTKSLDKVKFRWNGREFVSPEFSEVDEEEYKKITRDIFKEPDFDDF